MPEEIWTIHDIEAAINRLREISPSDGISLSRELSDLGDLYGRMIYFNLASVPAQALSPREHTLLCGSDR